MSLTRGLMLFFVGGCVHSVPASPAQIRVALPPPGPLEVTLPSDFALMTGYLGFDIGTKTDPYFNFYSDRTWTYDDEERGFTASGSIDPDGVLAEWDPTWVTGLKTAYTTDAVWLDGTRVRRKEPKKGPPEPVIAWDDWDVPAADVGEPTGQTVDTEQPDTGVWTTSIREGAAVHLWWGGATKLTAALDGYSVIATDSTKVRVGLYGPLAWFPWVDRADLATSVTTGAFVANAAGHRFGWLDAGTLVEPVEDGWRAVHYPGVRGTIDSERLGLFVPPTPPTLRPPSVPSEYVGELSTVSLYGADNAPLATLDNASVYLIKKDKFNADVEVFSGGVMLRGNMPTAALPVPDDGLSDVFGQEGTGKPDETTGVKAGAWIYGEMDEATGMALVRDEGTALRAGPAEGLKPGWIAVTVDSPWCEITGYVREQDVATSTAGGFHAYRSELMPCESVYTPK